MTDKALVDREEIADGLEELGELRRLLLCCTPGRWRPTPSWRLPL